MKRQTRSPGVRVCSPGRYRAPGEAAGARARAVRTGPAARDGAAVEPRTHAVPVLRGARRMPPCGNRTSAGPGTRPFVPLMQGRRRIRTLALLPLQHPARGCPGKPRTGLVSQLTGGHVP
jgi:hypothetical protein